MPAARSAVITSPANRSGPLRRRSRSKIPTSPPGRRRNWGSSRPTRLPRTDEHRSDGLLEAAAERVEGVLAETRNRHIPLRFVQPDRLRLEDPRLKPYRRESTRYGKGLES